MAESAAVEVGRVVGKVASGGKEGGMASGDTEGGGENSRLRYNGWQGGWQVK